MPCIPPLIRRPRRTVSPRKRSSGPLDGGFQCRASCESSILSRNSPDSVISGPGPLMPEKKDRSPLSRLLYHAFRREANAKTPAGAGKTVPGRTFPEGVRFAGQILRPPAYLRQKEKPHPETFSGCGEVLFLPVQNGRGPLISAEGIPGPGSAAPGTCSCTARKADRR